MAFVSSFEVDKVGMTVPYSPFVDDIRRNRGFSDVRGDPDRAREIAEAIESDALRKLLVRIADPASAIFSIGCDLGVHQEPGNISRSRREVAGGYVQVAGVKYDCIETTAYHTFAAAINAHVKSRVAADHWKINFIGKWVDFKLEGRPSGLYPSMWIWFYAGGRTPELAKESRERLIDAIDSALAMEDVLEALTSTK